VNATVSLRVPSETIGRVLVSVVEAISEDWWASRWMSDLEYSLWARRPDFWEDTRVRDLVVLGEAAGWWPTVDGVVSIDEWRVQYAAHIARAGVPRPSGLWCQAHPGWNENLDAELRYVVAGTDAETAPLSDAPSPAALMAAVDARVEAAGFEWHRRTCRCTLWDEAPGHRGAVLDAARGALGAAGLIDLIIETEGSSGARR